MTLEVFLTLLLTISILTGLTVESIKKSIGDECRMSSNLVAGITSIILSTVIGMSYCILNNIAFNSHIIIILIALIFLSWLCAMLGYDKVIQSIAQIKTNGGI